MKTHTGSRGHRLAAVLAAAAALVASGCSDDITCPVAQDGGEPYILAVATEGVRGDGAFTTAEVFCTADPLPGLLTAALNDRAFDATESTNEPPGLTASLDAAGWVCVPGAECDLTVTVDAVGIASATLAVPDPPLVRTVAPITVGDTLRVTWSASENADYYAVRVVLSSAAGDSLALDALGRDTLAVFAPDEIGSPGTIAGRVAAVAGPLPEAGAEGNVSGFGWGFFTFSVYDSSSLFQSSVVERAPRRDR